MKPQIGKSLNFKRAKLPGKKKLAGKYSFLEPINIQKHAEELFQTLSQDQSNRIWTYMSEGPFNKLSDFRKYLQKKDIFFYAIYSKKTRTFCGLASYLRVKRDVGVIEVGYITYAPCLQQTVAATESMFLMMQNVFENLGYRRYEWKCDNLNIQSKRAAVRLGFTFEGIFKQANIYKKRNRDTAWFSIIDLDWKNIKKKYQKYLQASNFDKNLKQKKRLKLYN